MMVVEDVSVVVVAVEDVVAAVVEEVEASIVVGVAVAEVFDFLLLLLPKKLKLLLLQV